MKYIFGCRHGEANKNLIGVYGGKGSSLTENGVTQITNLAKKIIPLVNKINLPINIYISGDRVQIKESAEILKDIFNISEISKSEFYKPIRLGVFDGMNREKQLTLYPDACKAHEQWEKGLIDVTESEKLVDGMQTAKDYYNQISTFLKSIPDNTINILIGTRSDLSCLENVIRGQSPEKYKAYKYYPFNYAQMTIAKIDANDNIKKVNLINEKTINNVDKFTNKIIL